MNVFSRREQVASFLLFCTPKMLSKMEFSMNIPMDTQDTLDEDENEPFDDFYTSLQELVAEAELRLMSHNDWIAMLVLVGTSDDKVRQELLAKVVPPTLEETIIMCRNEEKGRMGLQGLRSPDGVLSLHANSNILRDGMEEQLRRERCRDCGFGHMDKDHCPARSGTAKCHRSGKSGHFAPVCHLHKNDAQQEQSCNQIIIAGISTRSDISVCVMATSDRRVLGNFNFIPDTGAQGTVVGLEYLQTIGAVKVILKLEGRECQEMITFCRNIHYNYLSLNASKALGIVYEEFPRPWDASRANVRVASNDVHLLPLPQHPSEGEIESIRCKLMEEFNDVFSQDNTLTPMTGPPHHIELKPNAIPGYRQIMLDKESRDLTTVLTPWGRFIHTRGPMGMTSTRDTYNRRGDQAMDDLPNVFKVVDDICIAHSDF
ncbi:hypothetical protein TCAL_12317, partial [Tigriopus californicus]|eukprot:TCALIF_12317-PA protein Name:"Protein of unknown function" AED:0.17 eAED:0.22 QI:68/0/0/1/0.33/0.25/4/0/429